jgi:hypothetical protein
MFPTKDDATPYPFTTSRSDSEDSSPIGESFLFSFYDEKEIFFLCFLGN